MKSNTLDSIKEYIDTNNKFQDFFILIKDISNINVLVSNFLGYFIINKQIFTTNMLMKDKNYYEIYENNEEIESFLKTNFNFKYSKIDFQKFNKIMSLINTFKNKENVLYNFINDMYTHKKIYTKDIIQHLTNKKLIKHMLKLGQPKNECILNLTSSFGYFLYYMISGEYPINLKKICNVESNEDIISMSLMNLYLLTNSKKNIFEIGDIIHDNLLKDSYDLILCDFPLGIKNIIHAECCDRIKSLKIRGTKSEPLLLQLIMVSLNKNGRAIINVPNTLLNNDSIQHVNTRKYLLDNFNVTKIINVSNDFQINKDNNSSIIYFEKKGNTKTVSFYNLTLENNITIETKINEIEYSEIVKKEYNLYFEKYIEINKVDISKSLKLKDLADIVDSTNQHLFDTSKLNGNYLLIPIKEKMIEYNFNDFSLKKDTFTLIVKDSTICAQEYLNIYFNKIIKPIINTFTKGKLKKIDLNELNNIQILLPKLKIQKIVINYFHMNNRIIIKNHKQIELYENLKMELIDLYYEISEKEELKNYCTIETFTNTNDTIMIQRNSNLAGNVSLSPITENTNAFFLNNVTNINKKFLYYYLKQYESKLNKIANITVTTNLSKNNLEKFEIMKIDEKLQKDIVSQIKKYNDVINNIKEIEITISKSDIMKNLIDFIQTYNDKQ